MQPIEEIHPELFHYTGLAGLTGILESQEMWGTDARFLNDGTELVAFKDYLPKVIRPSIEEGLAELLQAEPEKSKVVEEAGGFDATVGEVIRGLVKGLYDTTFGADGKPPFADVYITSFCTPEKPLHEEHGLLSQWRGYGKSGGYALVFDTAALAHALTEEGKRWPNLFLFGGNAIYSDSTDDEIHAEFGDILRTISRGFGGFLSTSGDAYALDPLYPDLLIASCRYKHWGFREEREVRIVSIPPNRQILDEMKRRGGPSETISVHHMARDETEVPTIHLFDNYKESGERLPIRRIIVGPGGDRAARKATVLRLLRAISLDIPVSVSEIPYIDR